MRSIFSSTLLISSLALVSAAPSSKRGLGYANPADNGGSMFGHFPGGAAEPINLIVSANSDPSVIESEDGFADWYMSIGFNQECFGFHSGAAMNADLGDGRGPQNQTAEVRESYGEDPISGSCLESLIGGNHFRYWQQSTTNAWFLAASIEKDVSDNHDLVDDGYNQGRDAIVSAATDGITQGDNHNYTASVDYVEGLEPAGSNGVNHGIAIDGKVAVLTISVNDD